MPPTGMDEQSRYVELVDMIAELRRELQTYRAHADSERKTQTEEIRAVRQDVMTETSVRWQANAHALRLLSDWRAEDETLARKERAVERRKMAVRMGIVIALLIVIVGMLGYILL